MLLFTKIKTCVWMYVRSVYKQWGCVLKVTLVLLLLQMVKVMLYIYMATLISKVNEKSVWLHVLLTTIWRYWKICVITCTPNNNFEVLRNHEMFNWFMEFNKYQIYGSRQYPKKNCHWITMEVQSHNIITCYMLKLMLKCVMPMWVICV